MAVILTFVLYALIAGIVFGVLSWKHPKLEDSEGCTLAALFWPVGVPAICGYHFVKWLLKRFS